MESLAIDSKDEVEIPQTSPEEDQEQDLDKWDIAETFKPDCTKKSDLIDTNIFHQNVMIDDDNLIDNLREESNEEHTMTNEMTNRSIFSRVFSRFLECYRSLINRQRKPSTSAAVMPVPIDADRYNMNHKHRGKCIIFNHEEVDGCEKREGTTIDVERLENSFGRLGFDIEIENDLKYVEVMDKIEKVSQYDYTDNDCLCIIMLTHGFRNDMIWAKDAAYKSDRIWMPFTADKCPTLAGKPKLFFFQFCRGDQVDSGIVLFCRTLLPSETTDSVPSYKIPTFADFLIAHGSVQDFKCWRSPVEGTWYIQCLCKVLDEYGTEMDLMSMLTLTARKVATDFASINPMDKTMHDKKQVPSVTTMLIRSVYFPPKLSEKITTT